MQKMFSDKQDGVSVIPAKSVRRIGLRLNKLGVVQDHVPVDVGQQTGARGL